MEYHGKNNQQAKKQLLSTAPTTTTTNQPTNHVPSQKVITEIEIQLFLIVYIFALKISAYSHRKEHFYFLNDIHILLNI